MRHQVVAVHKSGVPQLFQRLGEDSAFGPKMVRTAGKKVLHAVVDGCIAGQMLISSPEDLGCSTTLFTLSKAAGQTLGPVRAISNNTASMISEQPTTYECPGPTHVSSFNPASNFLQISQAAPSEWRSDPPLGQ